MRAALGWVWVWGDAGMGQPPGLWPGWSGLMADPLQKLLLGRQLT